MKILSVSISPEKGAPRESLETIHLNENGIIGDAHSGSGHRQISLLAAESIRKFSIESGRTGDYGEYGENITTEGLELWMCHPLDRICIGEVELEVTQIGNEQQGHSHEKPKGGGTCAMHQERIFARVKKTGSVKLGDSFTYKPKEFRVQVITLSDRASRGEYEDKSGPAISDRIREWFDENGWLFCVDNTLIPDDAVELETLVAGFVNAGTDILITTGGTGIGPKDMTVDVIRPMLQKEIPGIMELIRYKYGSQKPNALISRAVAGVTGQTLIYTLPGSVRAVKEYLDEILPTFRHSILMLHGIDAH